MDRGGRTMISLDEQETVIQFNRTDKYATICTSDSTIMTKLDKLCVSAPDNYKLIRTETVDGKVVTKFYLLADKTRVSFRREKKVLSEERKIQLRERALNQNFGRSKSSTIDTENQNEVLV